MQEPIHGGVISVTLCSGVDAWGSRAHARPVLKCFEDTRRNMFHHLSRLQVPQSIIFSFAEGAGERRQGRRAGNPGKREAGPGAAESAGGLPANIQGGECASGGGPSVAHRNAWRSHTLSSVTAA